MTIERFIEIPIQTFAGPENLLFVAPTKTPLSNSHGKGYSMGPKNTAFSQKTQTVVLDVSDRWNFHGSLGEDQQCPGAPNR